MFATLMDFTIVSMTAVFVLIEIASLGIRMFDLKSPKNNDNITITTTIKR